MRRDELYLRDILEAVRDLADFVVGCSPETFSHARVIRWAVVQRLTTIGEAAARLSGEFKDGHLEVPWAKISAFRNILVHAYFGIRWERVWQAAVEEAPALGRQVQEILTAEFPDHTPEEGA